MQRDFNNRDFEQFVKQNADQYRMFPSEKVWQGINNALHTRRRWYGFGLTLLLLLTGTAVTVVMVTTTQNKPSEKEIAVTAATVQTDDAPANTNTQKVKTSKPAPASLATLPNESYISPVPNDPEKIFMTHRVASEQNIDQYATQPLALASQAAPAGIAGIEDFASTGLRRVINPVSPQSRQLAMVIPGVPSFIAPPTVAVAEIQKQAVEENPKDQVRSYIDLLPLSYERATGNYQAPNSLKKITMQFYLTPTISYRKLSENKKFLQSAANSGTVPVYAAYSDINSYVSHKPDMGLELGLVGKYAVSNTFRLRAGLQFNVSRYDIKAAYEQHREDATIALDGGNWGANSTITRQTNYRNFGGTTNISNWLKNLYYSVSLPLGAEYVFKSQSSTRFGVAATFQPTLVIKDRAYLITTDYKNYVEVPSLVRKVNMNTSFETFIAYSTGNINWQVGPQVRYQIFSSFEKKYPVKENLFDFGLKVGIQLNR